MTSNFTTTLLPAVISEYWNSWKQFLLSLGAGILITVSLYLFHVFSRKGDDTEKTARQNCWFCMEDVCVETEEKERWKCPHCEQYNGFTMDGDYIEPVKDQFDLKDFRTKTFCSITEFNTAACVLCENCSENQVLKVRQLAAFIPISEASYSSEVDMYREYLEHRYSLCNTCRQRVSEYLTAQDMRLSAPVKTEHLLVPNQLKGDNQSLEDNFHHTGSLRREPVICCVMLSMCVCAGIVQLLLHTCSCIVISSHNLSGIHQTVKSVLPAWLVVWGDQVTVCLGASFCICGLLAAGKYRLYPEDAVHLILWLVSMIIVFVLAPTSLAWLYLSREGALFVSAATVLASFICCLRSRHPRHITALLIQKKPIIQTDLKFPQRESTTDVGVRHGDNVKVLAQNTSPPSSSSSSFQSSTIRESTPDCENLRQKLESFSLGLNKKSNSSSSIWSLPAVVTSLTCDMTPDSSTDRLCHHVQQSGGVLYPSRLDFLKFRGKYTDSQPDSCRSPSPGISDSEDLHTHMNTSSSITTTQTQQIAHSSNIEMSSQNCVLPAQRLSTHSIESSHPCAHVHQSHSRVEQSSQSFTADQKGPCDSQTPDNTSCEISTTADETESCLAGKKTSQTDASVWRRPSRRAKISVSRNKSDVPAKTRHPAETRLPAETRFPADSILNSSGPRRSPRIANIGSFPRPWSLKKSFSCNNALDMGKSVNCDIAYGEEKSFNYSSSNSVEKSRSPSTRSLCSGHPVSNIKACQISQSSVLPLQKSSSKTCQISQSSVLPLQKSSSKTCQKNDSPSCRNILFQGELYRNVILSGQEISEFSDDDFAEVDVRKQSCYCKNGHSSRECLRNGISWTWTFVGIVIGASVSSNIFLVYQSWSA